MVNGITVLRMFNLGVYQLIIGDRGLLSSTIYVAKSIPLFSSPEGSAIIYWAKCCIWSQWKDREWCPSNADNLHIHYVFNRGLLVQNYFFLLWNIQQPPTRTSTALRANVSKSKLWIGNDDQVLKQLQVYFCNTPQNAVDYEGDHVAPNSIPYTVVATVNKYWNCEYVLDENGTQIGGYVPQFVYNPEIAGKYADVRVSFTGRYVCMYLWIYDILWLTQ